MYRRAQRKNIYSSKRTHNLEILQFLYRTRTPKQKMAIHIYIYIHICFFSPVYQNHIFLSVRKKFMYQRRTELLIANRDRIHLYTSLLLYRLYLSNILSIIVYQKSENYYHRQIAIACSAMMSNISIYLYSVRMGGIHIYIHTRI